MWKFLSLISLIILISLIPAPAVRAETLDDLQKQINDLQGKIAGSQTQQKSLSTEISKINDNITLTKLRIKSTEEKLGRLTGDIEKVTGKIQVLEEALTKTSEILANRIVQTYVAGRSDPVLYLFSASDFNEFLQRFEYLRIVQKHDKTLMFQMAATRKNYGDQKDHLEEKKKEEEILSAQLNNYQAVLDQQDRQKRALLEVTKNDEKRYQQLLAQAQAQLAAFRSFIVSQGGASLLSNQTSCDNWGCYYSQRDSQWGLLPIGLSSDSMAEYGCLVTSAAMVLSHYGHRVTPANVAQTYEAFFEETAYMLLAPWTIDGVTFERTSVGGGTSKIDSELAEGHPVIVGVAINGIPNSHFVVIKEKQGDNYIMNDPYVENGHDIPFASKYSLGSISAVNTIRVH